MEVMADTADAVAIGAGHGNTEQLLTLFDSVAASFREGVSYAAMAQLVDGLARLVTSSPGESWIEAAKRLARKHPIGDYVLECPFTRHSASKPRGYPGDAQLIDYIYRHPDTFGVEQQTSEFGRNVLLHNVDSPAPAAVRARRHLTAAYISDVVAQRSGVDIMSVACGHARELELLAPATTQHIARFVAYDQDARSLAVAAGYRSRGIPVHLVQGSIIELLRNGTLSNFDLIFSAGLYDYLTDRLAQRLTANLFGRLRSGGKLLVANFLPNIRDAGYMRIFMDWTLIHRTESQIRMFASKIDGELVQSSRYFTEPNRNVGFLELTRR